MDNPNWFKPESPPGPLHTWRLHSCCPTVDKWALQKQSATGANPMVFHALLNSGNPQKVHCCNTVEIQNKCKREWLRLKAWDLAHLRCFSNRLGGRHLTKTQVIDLTGWWKGPCQKKIHDSSLRIQSNRAVLTRVTSWLVLVRPCCPCLAL